MLWLSHPSARANEVERTKANSDAVRVFMALSFCLYLRYILKCFLIKIHSVTASWPIYVYSRMFYLFGVGITAVLTSDLNLT